MVLGGYSFFRQCHSPWRIGVNPPIAFLLLITIGLYLTIITAVKLTGRLTVPIERLHQAA